MMFKMALHSVSYAGFWPGQARLELDAFLQRASALGYEGVMLMAKRPHLSVLDFHDRNINQLADRLTELKLSVPCIAGYTDFTIGSDHPEIPTGEFQIAAITQLAKLATRLKCPLIRVFTAYDRANMSYDHTWLRSVDALRECARRVADLGVAIAVQNHHDTASHVDSLMDLLDEIDEPNCNAAFDAWAPALQGCDLAQCVSRIGKRIVHTTVADYVMRSRYAYVPNLVNYSQQQDVVRAVPMGDGTIDYRSFFSALREQGYSGSVAYEMCSPIRGGGRESNLDQCAAKFLKWMRAYS